MLLGIGGEGEPLDGLLEDPFLEHARNWAVLDRRIRGMSRSCSARSASRERSVRAVTQDRSVRAASHDCSMRSVSQDRFSRGVSPTPVKPRICQPRDCEVAYDVDGLPLYSASGLRRRPWADIFNPSASLPISAITRDPFWYDYPELRPVPRWNTSPFYVRDSYLSPVKRTFLWDKHPMRPLACH